MSKRSWEINQSRKSRKKIAKALKQHLADGTLTPEILDKGINQSAQLACPVKNRYNMEEAASVIMHYVHIGIVPYVCPCCGFVHLGHQSGWSTVVF